MRVADRMKRTSVTLAEHEDLERAASMMRQAKVSALPVVGESGQVIGVLTAADLPHHGAELRGSEALEQVPISRVMSSEVATIGPDATLSEAAGLMLEGGFRHLPVVDPDRTVLGMLSERDLRAFIGTDLRDFPHATRGLDELVSTAMTANPISLRADTRVVDALEVFSDERVGAVPVLDEDDQLVGILSYVDVLGWLQGPRRFEPSEQPLPL